MDIFPKMTRARKKLHSLAETGFELHNTREFMFHLLLEAGLKPEMVASGIVADTGESNKRILLRADMDALPLIDGKDVPYKSLREGACHACGHDAHMAMLYGAALLLSETELPGGIRYVFQPAEECPPGGVLGMIDAGILDGVDMAFALHVAPWLPFGTVGIKEGPAMAATDNFNLVIRGRSGHGAMPQDCADAIVAAAHVVTGLQTLVSRKADPLEPLVITIGKVTGGTACNVIADSVVLAGTARTMNAELRDNLPQWMERTAKNICAGFGAECTLDYQRGYPVLKNTTAGIELALAAAAKTVGQEKIIRLEKPLMGGEDFAYVLEKVPGAYLFLGTGDDKYTYPLHHPCFDFNEEILPIGAKLFRELARLSLGKITQK